MWIVLEMIVIFCIVFALLGGVHLTTTHSNPDTTTYSLVIGNK